jgi:probable F420-dependent oxidoreductase
MGNRLKIGVQLHPQHANLATLLRAAGELDELGVDSIWVWDHFFPVYGKEDGVHHEAWTTLAAVAARTRSARIGTLVSAMSYRNPDLLAHMACTVDDLSDGRVVLGVGAGWARRDYVEYGYDYGTAGDRSRQLAAGVRRLRHRLDLLRPERRIPLLIGGGGERATLRVAAGYADIWNGFGPARLFARKSRILDQWCERLGRDPALISRTVLMMTTAFDLGELVDAGADEVIVGLGEPFGTESVAALLRAAELSETTLASPPAWL